MSDLCEACSTMSTLKEDGVASTGDGAFFLVGACLICQRKDIAMLLQDTSSMCCTRIRKPCTRCKYCYVHSDQAGTNTTKSNSNFNIGTCKAGIQLFLYSTIIACKAKGCGTVALFVNLRRLSSHSKKTVKTTSNSCSF